MKKGLYIFAGILLFLADQVTKYLASLYLKGTGGIPVIRGVLELYYLYPENRGIAFGMFQGGVLIFAAATVVILAALFWFGRKIPDERRYLPLKLVCLLIAAGALGNLADRLVRGYVIDFIWFSLIDFPVFNAADIFVVTGCFLMIFSLLTGSETREEKT